MHFFSKVLNNVAHDKPANGTLGAKVDYKQICTFNNTHQHMKLYFEEIIKGLHLSNTENEGFKHMNVVLFESKTCEPKDITMSYQKSKGLIINHRYQNVYLNITCKRYVN